MFVLLYIAASIIFTEALTELFIKSVFMAPLREYIHGLGSKFLSKLFSCGYCFSVWAAILPSALSIFLLNLRGLEAAAMPVIMWLCVHRMSNYLHNINDNYFDKYYRNTKE